MKELYPGEYADLQERAQGECEAADAAEARLAALTPGTPEYDAAEFECYYCMLAKGHALWDLEQFEQEAAAADSLPVDPVRDAYIAWCDAEEAQYAAWDAYRQQPICTPAHDAAFDAWWAAIEAMTAARATYTRLAQAEAEAADVR